MGVVIEITENKNVKIAKIHQKLTFLIFKTKIIAIVVNIIEFRVADFDTHKTENRIVEVQTDPKNEPIVEKNKSFQIFSQAFSHSKISESKGMVWLA
ncbi:MAG: hypothetical protein LBQ24_03555 [Candidatus Peribacteria bacterium]|nr:hypothetical protein [Candidatus Peribacteria bacterium]